MPHEFVDISFPLPLNQSFTYRLPEDLRPLARIGSRVVAPFGPRRLTGFIVNLKTETDLTELKEIQDILDLTPPVSAEMLQLATWISEYYLCSLGEALKATVPASFLKTSRTVVELTTAEAEKIAAELAATAPRQAQILRYLVSCRKISLQQLKRKIGASRLVSGLNQLEEKGLVRLQQILPDSRPKIRRQKFIKINAEYFNRHEMEPVLERLSQRAPKQAECLLFLKEQGRELPLKYLLQQTRAGAASLKKLAENNFVHLVEKEVLRDYYEHQHEAILPEIKLNSEQAQVLSSIKSAIAERRFAAFLLHGVTGSGKTQVYIEAIYEMLQLGKDAIVLVPEISLTPQTVQRFRAHFKDQVAVLHSAMSEGERFDSWRLLKSGRARVAIGPRSAVFAPLSNLGLIIVDEEHETTYKQSDSIPRYHARDVAVVRARAANAVVVLGSATPSTESYHNARQGKYKLLTLNRRINDIPMPPVRIVNMLTEKRLSGKKEDPVFSRILNEKIEEKLARHEQIILLLNRRGFSSYLKCKDCGYTEECDNCNITLTYHLRGRRLRCHYCGFTKKAPDSCPDCANPAILFRGHGTQKVEEEVMQHFAQAKVVRMDLDTTGRKWSHDRILKDFERGKYDILLGTQMVAKGLDFNRVTLVGVINADVGLLLPDFRSSERIFQLLTQVAGRAGRRNLPGEVIIQTYSPDNFALLCAREHDFHSFFQREIAQRRELLYPPFGRLVHILLRGEDESRVLQAAHKFAAALRHQPGPFQILGPAPSPISKIQNKFRFQILLKEDKKQDPTGRKIRQAVLAAEQFYRKGLAVQGVRVSIDVDPVAIV